MNNDTKKRTEMHACDYISRQAVIDALYDWSEHSMTDAESWHIRQVIGDIKSLPPAEPNCSEIPNNSDCISRQAAITNIQKAYADTEGGTDKCAVWKNVGLTNALHIMQDLPSAQSASYRQVTGKLDSASRQAEIDAWKADFKGYVDSLDLLRDDYNGIMEYIDETPSAQSEIIRCKDCKYQDEGYRRISVKWLPCMDIRPGSNWYCGSAERREE